MLNRQMTATLRITLMCVLAVVGMYAIAANDSARSCAEIAKKVEKEKARIATDVSGRKVIGNGRLYFYTAPSPKCRQRKTFVVPGDLLDAYADFGKYTEVVFWNTRKNTSVEGWVETARLRETGTGIGPKQN